MNKESVIQMWEDYRKVNPDAPKVYDAWAVGATKEIADELAECVLERQKKATSSSYKLYGIDDEELPYVGLHNVMLDGDGKAVAILETTSVEVVPFDEVTEDHAYLEGEGDRTLKYWREIGRASCRERV